MSKSTLSVFLFKMLFLAFLLTTGLLFLLAWLLYQFKWDSTMTTVGVYAIYFLSCLLPAYLTGKKMRSRRLLWGLLVGALYFLLFFAVSAILGTELFAEAGRLLTVLGLCLGGGALGGVAS